MVEGKVALVTGAGRGIGWSIAVALSRQGYRVACADLMDGLGVRMSELPGEAMAVQVDVSDWQQVNEAVAQVEARWGPVAALVNNAALVKNIGRCERLAPEAWNQELAVNLSGPFYLIRRTLPGMMQHRWGRIVNISSIAVRGLDRQVAYAASKAGLIGLTRTVALEHAAEGITCNAILPGLIATENVLTMPDEIREQALTLIPADRLGEPGEVAGAVAFLASPAASYINGAVLSVDGGAALNQMSLARRPRRRE